MLGSTNSIGSKVAYDACTPKRLLQSAQFDTMAGISETVTSTEVHKAGSSNFHHFHSEMSRTNSKIALQLREADTIKTNKTVLKAGGMALSSDVFEVLDQSNSKYEDKMANLLKFNARNKKTMKVSSHMTEWMDEQMRLQNLANKIELSVGSILETAIAQTPEDEELLEIMDITNGYHSARKKNQAELASQLRNIKDILKDSVRRGQAGKKVPTASEEETKAAQTATTQAILADLFIKIRTDQAKVWQYWQAQENELRREVQSSSQQLAKSLRQDGISTQDAKLRAEFAAILSACSVPEEVGVSQSGKRGVKQEGAGDGGSMDKEGRHGDEGSVTASVSQQLRQTLEADLELVMDEWLHKIALLDKAQELRVIEKETEKAVVCQELGLEFGAHCKNAGWSDADHDMFVKIYRKAQVTGMQRKNMLQILTAELPQQSQEAINLHEEWYRKMKFLNNKYKESEAVYTTTRADLVAQAKQNLHEHRAQRLEMLEREREQELHEKHRSEIHARLQQLLARKDEMDSVQRAEREKQEAALRARLAEQEEQIRLEKLEKKQQVEKYKQLREAAEAQAEAAHEAQVRAAQEAVRQLIEQNRPNVERREQLLSEKLDKKRQKEMEAELEEMRRIEMLNQLAAQVPYYDAIQDATSKLDHITASAKGHEYIACDDPQYRGHLPLNGFTDGRVIQDSRFRLAEALRRCGVAGSEAARSAVAKFYPRPHLAIHGLL